MSGAAEMGRVVTDEMLEAAVRKDLAGAIATAQRKSIKGKVRDGRLMKNFALRDRTRRRPGLGMLKAMSYEAWMRYGCERFYAQIDYDLAMWEREEARKLGVRSVLEADRREERFRRNRRKILVADLKRRGVL